MKQKRISIFTISLYSKGDYPLAKEFFKRVKLLLDKKSEDIEENKKLVVKKSAIKKIINKEKVEEKNENKDNNKEIEKKE